MTCSPRTRRQRRRRTARTRAVAEPDQRIFQREGADQRRRVAAERLQHHRVVDARPVSGGQRARQHQHRGDRSATLAAPRIAVPSCPTSG